MRKRDFIILMFCVFTLLISCDNSVDPTSTEDDSNASVDKAEDKLEDVEAENSENHESTDDYTWNESDVISITFNGNSISSEAEGVAVTGSQLTIMKTGTYKLNGVLTDGQIIVNSEDEGIVRLILNGINVSNSTSAPIFITNSEKTMLVLADNTENILTDGTYYISDTEEDEPNATIFSKDDLTIYGEGALIINANYNDGITSKDGLIIKSGKITVRAVDDGIRGKDYLIIKDGDIIIDAGGDGLKSDNESDDTKGYITIVTGMIDITSGGDAIAAQTDVLISDGDIKLKSGGGSSVSYYYTSAKGIKAGASLIIDGENIEINSADDGIHSNGSISINGGSLVISSGDDGIHADSSLKINGGDIQITKSYEGIESAIITINDGDIHIVSSDDGINVAGGNDGSGMRGWGGQSSSGNYFLYINGANVVVNASGDGIDANGSIVMTGGRVLVHGPTGSMNGALDYDSSFEISGGLLVAAGSSRMAQSLSSSSSQCSLLFNFNSSQSAGSIFHIQSGDGSELLSFVPSKRYQSIVFSSSALTKGSSYDVYTGGSSSGSLTDGLYDNGSYTSGTKYGSFTISATVTKVNNR